MFPLYPSTKPEDGLYSHYPSTVGPTVFISF